MKLCDHIDRIHVLVNTSSGGGKGRTVLDECSRGAFSLPLSTSSVYEPLPSFSDKTLVIIAGGDGTLSRFLTQPPFFSLFGASLRGPPVMVLPLGTANDFSRALPSSCLFTLYALERLLEKECHLIEYPIGKATGELRSVRFLNYLSFGFDAEVVHHFAKRRITTPPFRSLQRWINRLAYLQGAFATFRHPSIAGKVTTSSHSHSFYAKTLLITTLPTYMGIGKSSRQGDPFDKRFELLPVQGIYDYFRLILRMPPKPLCVENAVQLTLPSGTFLQVDGEAEEGIHRTTVEVQYEGFCTLVRMA